MNKRPGHVVVTTEIGFCSFCGRPRSLRREQHQLGTLVRTITTCETCHRTLSSTIGIATAPEPVAPEPAAVEPEPAPEPAAKPTAKKTSIRKPAATKATPKSRAPKK